MSTHVKSTNDEEVGVGAWPQGATEMRGGKKGDILKLVRLACQHLHYVRSQLLLLHASLSFFLPLLLVHAGHANLVPGSG